MLLAASTAAIFPNRLLMTPYWSNAMTNCRMEILSNFFDFCA